MQNKNQKDLISKINVNPEVFKQELNKYILLSDDDKEYWLNNTDNLPLPVLETIYENICAKNVMVRTYLFTALDNDKGNKLVNDLKFTINGLKKSANKIEETDQQNNAEALLDQDLANL